MIGLHNLEAASRAEMEKGQTFGVLSEMYIEVVASVKLTHLLLAFLNIAACCKNAPVSIQLFCEVLTEV